MIYNRNVDGVLENAIKNSSEVNKKILTDFINFLKAQGLSKARQIKYIYHLKQFARHLDKDFPDATKDDMIRVFGKIESSELKEWTKVSYKVIVKRFYKWIREREGAKLGRRQYPEEVEWISTTLRKSKRRLPEELLTPEEVKAIADKTKNPRDRAIVLGLYETGARIGELLSLRIMDINFTKFGADVLIREGKTGARKIMIVSSAPAINQWLNVHPKREDKNAYLFCEIQSGKEGKQLVYEAVNKMLKKAAKRAGIEKPVNPHNFRHSRATYLAKHFTESQLCQFMGWVQGSKEAATYVHLSGRDMDSAILSLYGLKEKKEEKEDNFKPIRCPRCNQLNDPAAKFCIYCGLPLDEETISGFDKKREDATIIGQTILSDSRFKDALAKFIADFLEEKKIGKEELKERVKAKAVNYQTAR